MIKLKEEFIIDGFKDHKLDKIDTENNLKNPFNSKRYS